MKKVPYERLDHVISTGRSGKGNNNRYRFNDFSDLRGVKDLFPNLDWTRGNKKPKNRKKTHKKKPSKFSSYIDCNRTHITIPCEIEGMKHPVQQIMLLRKVAPSEVLGMYPRVIEIHYSYDGEVFSDEVFRFGNTK